MNDVFQPVYDMLRYGLYTGLVAGDEEGYVLGLMLDFLGIDTAKWVRPDRSVFDMDGDLDEFIADGRFLRISLKELYDFKKKSRGISGMESDSGSGMDFSDFESGFMNLLIPRPHEVNEAFRYFYKSSPREATDWFYRFSKNTGQVDRIYLAQNAPGEVEDTVRMEADLPKEPLFSPGQRQAEIDINARPWKLSYRKTPAIREHFDLRPPEGGDQKGERFYDILVDFAFKFPHYFIGAMETGGCMRYFGGRLGTSLDRAKASWSFSHPAFSDVHFSVCSYPCPVIRMEGYNPPSMQLMAEHIRLCAKEKGFAAAVIFRIVEKTSVMDVILFNDDFTSPAFGPDTDGMKEFVDKILK